MGICAKLPLPACQSGREAGREWVGETGWVGCCPQVLDRKQLPNHNLTLNLLIEKQKQHQLSRRHHLQEEDEEDETLN